MSVYIPPNGNVIALDFKGLIYTPPLGNVIALNFAAESGVISKTQYLFPVPIDSLAISAPSIKGSKWVVNGIIGIEETLVVSEPGIKNKREVISFEEWQSWQSSEFGYDTSIVNFHQTAAPDGFESSEHGYSLIYNKKQFITLDGIDSEEFGDLYLQGGVKYLEPYGIDSEEFGEPYLVKYLEPTGIDSLVMPAPSVSPRMLYPDGIFQTKIGVPDIRIPVLLPNGFISSLAGTPTVWFHTRNLSPNGILAYESGFAIVADPTQFIQTPSLLTSAIFGDTAIINKSTIIKVKSIDDGRFSDYATLTNKDRYYAPMSIDSLVIGAVLITNKTPSLFVDAIEPFDTGTPAIGHAIRFLQPSGFDHLLLGNAVLTTTPELNPIGSQSSEFGDTTIWYKNRTLDLIQKGIDSFNAGEITVWYGQRPIIPDSWQSSDYGEATLTHQLRELIAQGYKADDYGEAWISFGTRRIEPVAIYTEFPSSHMVGGTQTIMPAGYEATLWGERIIPIRQSLQPLGFTGVWGNATVDLLTKYIAPVGYISVGQQPQDRWGDIVVYNKLQYIVQEYDVNSGLVPPKWSDYLLIANRNIQMNVTGFISQKFGYSQIDNNATPLLPAGIEPPVIAIGMVSHKNRTIALDAIEPPLLSTWGVVHNSGRVIAPVGHDQSQGGNEGTLVNTRREYRNVGRIDSLEMGAPMIAYRIRTIDIEPRYSIAPPQIELPTIDLYTKYLTLRGYETAKYGYPSLSIHFNIIGPSWRHRDNFGYGTVVRNRTPALLVGSFDSSEFGNTAIRTQWRFVKAQGDTATLFGSAMIADTKQQIGLRGWQDSVTSQLHAVTKTGAPPYTTQNIWHANEINPSANGDGSFEEVVGTPSFNQNVLYHAGHDSQEFGDTIVQSNNLYLDVGISTKNIEFGPVVSNKKQHIDVIGIKNEIAIGDQLTVSPFYIYPSSFNQPYDGQAVSVDKFGQHTLTNQHRVIYPDGYTSSIVSESAATDLHTRYVKPPTIRGSFMGIPEIPFTKKTINIDNNSYVGDEHGTATVSRPPYLGAQIVALEGIENSDIGAHSIELLVRNILTVGSDMLEMGISKSDDTPYMWQGLRIGEFVPMNIGAGDTSVFGETVIGLRVREILLEGFVAFRSEYDINAFGKRMKITRSESNADVLTQGVNVIGIDSEIMGAIDTKWGQQFIRPDGSSNQFRKGGYHA